MKMTKKELAEAWSAAVDEAARLLDCKEAADAAYDRASMRESEALNMLAEATDGRNIDVIELDNYYIVALRRSGIQRVPKEHAE